MANSNSNTPSIRGSLGDSSDDCSEGGSSSKTGSSRRSVICYTERGIAYPSKLSLSSEDSQSEEDSSVSDKNSIPKTPSRTQSSEFEENEEFSLRGRSLSSTEEDREAWLLAELEAIPQIAGRFTDEDSEYAAELAAPPIPPPVITQWSGRSRQYQGNRGRGGFNNQYHQQGKRRYDNGEESNDNDRGKMPRRDYNNYNNRGDDRNNQYRSNNSSRGSSYSRGGGSSSSSYNNQTW